MPASPVPAEHSEDLHARVIRLEEWRESHTRETAEAKQVAHDHEQRIRAMESSYVSLSARLTLIASIGAALGGAAATALVQLALRAWGA